MNELKDTKLRALLSKPRTLGKKHFDGLGLFVRETPNGLRWYMKIKLLDGKESTLSFGPYPEVTIAEARNRRDDARRDLRNGVDPRRQRQDIAASISRFRVVAEKWFRTNEAGWSVAHAVRLWRRLELYVFPRVGDRDIATIKRGEMYELFSAIEKLHKLETARRVAIICGQIFDFAIALELADSNPARAVLKLLQPVHPAKPMAALKDEGELGRLIRMARAYCGKTPVVRAALLLLPHLLLRPGELRNGRWEEIDLGNATWTIPSVRMKRTVQMKLKGEPHVVPLSSQALALLKELHQLTGPSGLVFKGHRSAERPISDGTINMALRALGYDTSEVITAQGFRATARTLGAERLGIDERVLEAQLAHAVPDALGRAYNRTEFLPQRRAAMQQWSDYLDRLARDIQIAPGGENAVAEGKVGGTAEAQMINVYTGQALSGASL